MIHQVEGQITMNDLTKEELTTIYGCVDLFTEGSRDREKYYGDIFKKLQSMIDNYCEHEFQEDLHHMDIFLCIRCGRREWWENK